MTSAEPEAPLYLGALEASGELTDEQRKALFDSVTVRPSVPTKR